MQPNNRGYYLDQLGIERWVLRRSIAPQDSIDSSTDLSQSQEIKGSLQEAGSLASLKKKVCDCQKCPLHTTRTQTVFARGSESAQVMIIGEAPGFYEDKAGKPFVGKAGGLLDKMLASIGLGEESVYIANVLKCRPPNNRDPVEDEIKACTTYLMQQIDILSPKLILALGRFAGQFIIQSAMPLGKMRNKIHHYRDIPVIVSYHPAYLLRNPADKKKTYIDLSAVLNLINELTQKKSCS